VYEAERQFAAGVYAPEATARQRRVGSRTPEEWSALAVIASVIVAVISAIAAVIALFIQGVKWKKLGELDTWMP
jgi:hypothetical protein